MSMYRYSGMVTVGLSLVAGAVYWVLNGLARIAGTSAVWGDASGALLLWAFFVIGVFVTAYGLFGGIREAIRGDDNSRYSTPIGADDSTEIAE